MRIRTLAITCIAALIYLSPKASNAEGGCPEGMYPIHSPGVMGCAPMPVSQPRGPRWTARWGAVATAEENTSINGVSSNEESERRANKVAMTQCRNSGGKKCKVAATYSNSCFYAAAPYDGENRLAGHRRFSWGGQAAEAEASALRDCMEINKTSCRIEYSACSLPVLVE